MEIAQGQAPAATAGRSVTLAFLARLAGMYLPIGALLAAGIAQRLASLDSYHPGDTTVMLRVTDALLSGRFLDYYRHHAIDQWIYNHLPLFPTAIAPLYWLLEQLQLDHAWAVKMAIGLADLIIAVLIYWRAGDRLGRLWGLAIAAVWLLPVWVVGGDDHPIAVAVALALLGLANLHRSWLAGLLFGLGVATRTEVVFLATPVVVHFLSKRSRRDAVRFVGLLGLVIGVIALPFIVYDFPSFDYALRRQLQRDAADLVSIAASQILPHLRAEVATAIQENPSLQALAFNAALALLAVRDRRIERVVAVAAVGYLLTLPLVHERYMLFAYAVLLYYAAKFRNPLVPVGAVYLLWLDAGYGTRALFATFAGLALTSLAYPDTGPTPRRPLHLLVLDVALGGRTKGRVALLAALVSGLALVYWGNVAITTQLVEPVTNRFVNLISKAKDKKLNLEVPHNAKPDDYIHWRTFTIEGDTREVLYMHPASSAWLWVWLPQEAKLEFALGVDPEVWGKSGDGVEFQVEVKPEGASEAQVAYSAFVDPKNRPGDRRWVDVSVDLSRFAHKEVQLRLRTLPGASGDYDWAGWAMPVVRR